MISHTIPSGIGKMAPKYTVFYYKIQYLLDTLYLSFLGIKLIKIIVLVKGDSDGKEDVWSFTGCYQI